MDLSTMRSRVAKMLGLSSASDVPDGGVTRVDDALNRVYRFEIPDRLAGKSSHGYHTIALTQGKGEYAEAADFPDVFKNIKGPVYLSGVSNYPLDFYTDAERFWIAYAITATDEAQPKAVLWDGTSQSGQGAALWFRPIPDQAYTAIIYGDRYRAALTSSGIGNDTEAHACIAGAAQDIAREDNDDAVLAIASAAFEQHMGALRGRYQGAPQEGMHWE